ncbi:MAG: hypothetical protein IJC34_04400 [Lentisphaeria bacterium]|nr:hypothetical protein [Lentisphaeria bacterium]
MKIKISSYPLVLKFAAVILPLLLALMVLSPSIPLGEPGVWVWQRILPFQPDLPGMIAVLFCFAISAAAAWKLDFYGGNRKTCIILAVIILLGGIGADRMILTSGRVGLAENALAILNPFTTGYLQPAYEKEALTRDFVQKVLTVPRGEVPHHRHVHPPANIYLAELVKKLPGNWGRAFLPDVYRILLTLKQENALTPPLDTPEMIEAALKLVILFGLALEVGKLLLAYMLWNLPGIKGRGIALLAIAMGGNAAVLFLGHYDTFYFLISALTLLMVFYAFRHPAAGAFAGILTGIGGLFTLGFGSVGGLAAGVLLTGTKKRQTFGFFAGAGLIMAAMLYCAGIPVWDIAWKCLENQQLFQQMSGRGYWIWSALNVLDALLFCGVLPSLMILVPPAGRGRVFQMWLCALFFWLFILFSGGARGEFGRLAVVYLPALLLILGIRLGETVQNWYWKSAAIVLMLCQTALLRNALKLVLID